MLQFLQTGNMLYVLAAVCGLGIISKLVASGSYKRLIKETGNMALTKNRNLKSLKQKMENMFLMSQNLRNTNAYIEKQLYGFQFMGISLDNWDNVSVQTMILCFLAGGLAAFGSYWYRIDSYYIVLYGTMGILSGLLLVLVDSSVNTSMKRQQLLDCLVDYVDNSPHLFRNVEKGAGSNIGERRGTSLAESSKLRLREMERKNEDVQEGIDERKKQGKLSVLSRKKSRKEPELKELNSSKLVQEEQLRMSIDSLKTSLEQIAAGRDHGGKAVNGKALNANVPETGSAEKPRKELTQEEIRIIGELLQEYLP